MNDDTREKLSAYLDGALPDAERRALELEISRSEELRLELEALRAVSTAVKGLPKAKLPAGFAARLEARRAREGSAAPRDYFILPPAYRPLAFALSTAVVALVVWDGRQTSPDILETRAGWDSEKVGVKSAADAPPSVDVTGQLSAMGASGAAESAAPLELTDKKEDAAKGVPSTIGKQLSAPGKPLEVQESDALAGQGGGAGFAALSAPAASAPAPEPSDGSGAFIARNEEERSAINERLYKGFEEEKKRMGIARIVDKDAEAQELASGGRDLMALQASPEAPSVDRGRAPGSIAAVRGAKAANRASAPIVKALTLKSVESLQAAWAAAGLAGEPPAVNFPAEMAVFLACPSGCAVVSVQERKTLLVVLYKEAALDDAAARVRAVPLSAKPVVVKLAQ